MANLKSLLCMLFCFSNACFGQNNKPPDAGDGTEYVLNFASPVYVCADEVSQAFVDTAGVEVQRYNETVSLMTGVINFKQKFDESTMLEMIIDKETSGQYSMVLSHEICDICKEMGNPDSQYYDYLKYFGFPEKCPFEPGEYKIHDLLASTTDLPINSANSGNYQVTLNLYNNPDGSCKNEKKFLACLKLDFIIEPN